MLKDIPSVWGSWPSLSALDVRNKLKYYINSTEGKHYINRMEGSLSWQWEHTRSRGTVLQ